MLKEIKKIINDYADRYAAYYMESDDFIDGEEPDGSPSVDVDLMHEQALWELVNTVSKALNFLEFDYDREKAHDTVMDIVDTAGEYLEALPKVKLPATTTLNRVLNALTSRMAKGMDSYEAFLDAEQDKQFGKDLHLMIMGYKE